MSKKAAIEEAINFAVENNYLEGFFKTQKAEVLAMSLTEFDEEETYRVWREDGYEDGREDGKKEKAIEDAVNFLKMNVLTPGQIAHGTGLSLDEVMSLQEKIAVHA